MSTPSDGARGTAVTPRPGRRLAGSGPHHPFLRTLDSGLTTGRSWTEPGAPASTPSFMSRPSDSWPNPGSTGEERLGRDTNGGIDGDEPAVLELVRDDCAPVLTAVGAPERLAAVLDRVAADLEREPRGVTVTRGTGRYAAGVLARWGLEKASEWDRMAVTSAPDVPAAAATIDELDLARDTDEIEAFLKSASPRNKVGPRVPGHAWFGVRGADGRLGAVGASTTRESDDGTFAHLRGIATRPDLRGQGLATALVARLAARGIRDHGLVTLGMHADNDPARRVYERLGFRVIHEVETWRPAGCGRGHAV